MSVADTTIRGRKSFPDSGAYWTAADGDLRPFSIRRDAGSTVRSCERDWLETHHDRSPDAWVIQWRTATGRRRLSYEDLVEEGLCFGWIDSKARKLDDERSMITMTPRRPTSVWSRSNKERVARLTAEGRMTEAGLRTVAVAKSNGSWDALDEVDAMILPDDLVAALATDERARLHFEGFPPSRRRMILYWIKSAKRAETRARRIAETVRLAADNRSPVS